MTGSFDDVRKLLLSNFGFGGDTGRNPVARVRRGLLGYVVCYWIR